MVTLNEHKVKAKEWQGNCFSISKNTPPCDLTLASLAAMESTEIPPTPAENKLRNSDLAKWADWHCIHFPSLAYFISQKKKQIIIKNCQGMNPKIVS